MKEEKQNSKDKKKRYIYNFRSVKAKLVFRGFAILLSCTAVGILFSQSVGYGLSLLGGKCQLFTGSHFSDFLGGALGLALGFFFDRICIDKINHVSKCKDFIMSVKHELDKIYAIMTNEEQQIVLVKNGQEVPIEFDDNGNVSDKINGKGNESIDIADCSGYKRIEELIFDDLVTSVEAMSLISSLPLAKREFINQVVDFLGLIHKDINEYNEKIKEAEKLKEEAEKLKKKIQSEEHKDKYKDEYYIKTLYDKMDDYKKYMQQKHNAYYNLCKEILKKKNKLNLDIKKLTLNEKEISIKEKEETKANEV